MMMRFCSWLVLTAPTTYCYSFPLISYKSCCQNKNSIGCPSHHHTIAKSLRALPSLEDDNGASEQAAANKQEAFSASLLKARLDRETREQQKALALKAERETQIQETSLKEMEEAVDKGELCFLPEFELSCCDIENTENLEQESFGKFQQRKQESRVFDRLVNLIPFGAPIMAFLSYERIASLTTIVAELVANRNFVEVDGGTYRATIIAPAVNGIVVPACVVTFATLLSITISLLRQRQQEIRTSINTEASELRILQAVVDAMPQGLEQEQCWTYLIQYTSRLISESQPSTKIDALEATSGESEMNGFLTQLISFENVRDDLRSQSYSAIARLNSERSARISSLQSTFPGLHYVTLGSLAVSILSCFLLETDQDVLVFLYAFQLRFLWAILTGVFTGFGVVVYDLIDPFQGTYQISGTVNQLYILRSSLCVSVRGSSCTPSSCSISEVED